MRLFSIPGFGSKRVYVPGRKSQETDPVVRNSSLTHYATSEATGYPHLALLPHGWPGSAQPHAVAESRRLALRDWLSVPPNCCAVVPTYDLWNVPD